jgi:Pet100
MAKGRKGLYLEGYKFALYLIIPIGISWYYTDPERQKRAVDYWKFVQYPAVDNPKDVEELRQQVLNYQKQEVQRQVYRDQLRDLHKQANKTIAATSTTMVNTTTTTNSTSSNDEKEEKKSSWWRWIGLGR